MNMNSVEEPRETEKFDIDLGDGNSESHNCKVSKRYKILAGFLVCLVIAGIVFIAVSTTKDDGNIGRPEKINQNYSCIHSPIREYSYNESSNPLGDLCLNGSETFKATCPTDGVISEGNCRLCNSVRYTGISIYAPSRCFCDIGIQYGLCDQLRKSTCKQCAKSSPCENGGTYKCTKNPEESHECECLLGFEGRYCEKKAIVYLCKHTHNADGKNFEMCNSQVPHNRCILRDRKNETLVCHIEEDVSFLGTSPKCDTNRK